MKKFPLLCTLLLVGCSSAQEPAPEPTPEPEPFSYELVSSQDGFVLPNGYSCYVHENGALACSMTVGEHSPGFGAKTEAPSVVWDPSSTMNYFDSGYPGYFAPAATPLSPGQYMRLGSVSCWSNADDMVACFGGRDGEGFVVEGSTFTELEDPASVTESDQILTTYAKFTFDSGAVGYMRANQDGIIQIGDLDNFNLGSNNAVVVQPGEEPMLTSANFGQDLPAHQELTAGETREFSGFTITNTGDAFIVDDGERTFTLTVDGIQ